MGEVVLVVRRLAQVGLVDQLAVGSLDDDPGVDPAAAGGLAVVGHVGESVERLPLLVDDLAVLVGDVGGGVAVDLLQNQIGAWLILDLPLGVLLFIQVIPEQVLDGPIMRIGAVLVQLFEATA